jgi:hypothetical protein
MSNSYYFINITNHPAAKWSAEQLDSAKRYGNVVDIPFPQISPTATQDEIKKMAKSLAADICGTYQIGDGALVQGEMTFTYVLVHELQARGIVCFAACSERVTEEVVNPDGTTTKRSTFKFVQFREYPTF